MLSCKRTEKLAGQARRKPNASTKDAAQCCSTRFRRTARQQERQGLWNGTNKTQTPSQARRHPRKSAAAGAAELRPMEITKRKHRASATLQHTISRNSAASGAELGPMKQRHMGTGTMNIRNGTENKRLSELEHK
ncbi:hypothetical protein ARMSODRAFT_214588 [Armillaria solidipes]|uniref:Uncharacterized protein n=1 Tax=Armillaria solidipes TaxID=1076256 RepID=A0A2H3BHC5_9AGAR|nr:hypothetical protein ARMSODRAFT_214588 [Armillaria solidipes]